MAQVTVVLPVYNGEEHLEQAVTSILDQSFRDLQLVIVDDASTDNSLKVLEKFSDPRIVVIQHSVNTGLPGALLDGISRASGEYIARQDQDDFSHPMRLEKQCSLLNFNRSLGLVGTWASILNVNAQDQWVTATQHRHPSGNSILKWRMLWSNPFVHSSMMMRHSVLETVGSYDTSPDRALPEDFDLWSRMARISEVANIPEVLQSYRQSPTGMSRTFADQILNGVIRVASENMGAALGLEASDPEVRGLVQALNHSGGIAKPRSRVAHWAALLNRAANSIDNFPITAWVNEVAPTQLRMMHNALIG